VLSPDVLGCHLRQLAEHLAHRTALDSAQPHLTGQLHELYLDQAAETIASYIYLVWNDSGPHEYAPRMLEILLRLQARMRGMDSGYTWEYALTALNTDIVSRLGRAVGITIDPAMESALIHHFFDSIDDYEYLHDVVMNIMHFHWQRHHQLGTAAMPQQARALVGFRGEPTLEQHLRRSAIEGLSTYIEQSNIARGNMENPTDSMVVLGDRIEIQLANGGKNSQTWAESGWELADSIEARFGTSAGRREARRSRSVWKAFSRSHHATATK
jgi:hypothetical protein